MAGMAVRNINGVRENIRVFSRGAVANSECAETLIKTTTYWVFDSSTGDFGPSKFVGQDRADFADYQRRYFGCARRVRPNGSDTKDAIAYLAGDFAENPDLEQRLIDWLTALGFGAALGGVAQGKWQFASVGKPVPNGSPRPPSSPRTAPEPAGRVGQVDPARPTNAGALHDRIAESFKRQRLLATLGARLAHVADGEVDIELPHSEAIQQQHGFVHAGAIATIADSACGYACLTKMPEGSAVLSVEFKINLLAPAVGERFVARARTVRVGRTVGVATAEVIAKPTAGAEVCVAIMQATMMRLEPQNGSGG